MKKLLNTAVCLGLISSVALSLSTGCARKEKHVYRERQVTYESNPSGKQKRPSGEYEMVSPGEMQSEGEMVAPGQMIVD